MDRASKSEQGKQFMMFMLYEAVANRMFDLFIYDGTTLEGRDT